VSLYIQGNDIRSCSAQLSHFTLRVLSHFTLRVQCRDDPAHVQGRWVQIVPVEFRIRIPGMPSSLSYSWSIWSFFPFCNGTRSLLNHNCYNSVHSLPKCHLFNCLLPLCPSACFRFVRNDKTLESPKNGDFVLRPNTQVVQWKFMSHKRQASTIIRTIGLILKTLFIFFFLDGEYPA